MKKNLNRKFIGMIALALVCVMAGYGVGINRPAAQAEENTVVLTSPFTEAISKVHDSVVGVNNYQLVNNYDNGYGYGNGNGSGYGNGYGFPWDYFGFGGFGGYGYGNGNGYGYGNGNSQDSSREVHYASGSGVVIAEGYVLTNYHVVDGAHSLKISVSAVGQSEPELYDATLVASDQDKDVAVLYAPDLKLAPVELGDSDTLQLGDWAICIGNPLGFTGSVTTGIVSGLDREIASNGTTTDRYGRTTNVVNKMIQTDAAINSGISGGGMFNTAGQLVGIPTLKYSGSRYSSNASVENVGMCIPINEAKPVIEEGLKQDPAQAAQSQSTGSSETGSESLRGKPRMGVTVTTLNVQNGQLPNGAYVISVDKDSPAETAGILAGDIIVEINGEVVSSVSEMMGKISGMQEGDLVKVKVFRPAVVEDAEQARISTDGEYRDLELTLAIVDAVAQ